MAYPCKSSKKKIPYKDKVAYWESVVTDYKNCNMSQRDFCASRQIPFEQFRYWIRRLKKLKSDEAQPGIDDAIDFIPIAISDHSISMHREPLHIEYLWGKNRVSMDVQVSTTEIQQLIQRIGDWYAQL